MLPRSLYSLRCLLLPFLISCSLLGPFNRSSAAAQTPAAVQAPVPRLHGPITATDRLPLPGSRSPLAHLAQDLGPVSPDKVLPGITLVFRHSAQQQADLDALLAAQTNKSSPQYHHWLTPSAFAARFGVADADLAATSTWLASQGFHDLHIGSSRDRVTFTGTAAQVDAAFHASLHTFLFDGARHFAPSTDLTLPAVLTPLTSTVLHLSDLRPKPSVTPLRPRPAFTTSQGTHFLTPADIDVMYDVRLPSFNANTGLAVVGQSYVDPGTSVQSFQYNASVFSSIHPVLLPDSGIEETEPGAQAEGELDLEYASSINPNANVYYLFVGDNQNYGVFDAVVYAIQQNIAPVISISYGECETLLSASDLDQFNTLFMQASAQGQTVVASSGDSGSTGCSRFTSEGLTPAQQQALSVDFPADNPWVTAVGGTQMATGTFAVGNTQFWAPSTTSLGGARSLLSYVPETVWNEGTTTEILAGGGGLSAYYPRGPWQVGVPGIRAGTFRALPDIALQSSTSSPGFVLCTSDPRFLNEEGQSRGCINGLLGSNGYPTLAGGTSFAAPIFAGLVSILNQATASSQGSVNPILYGLAADAPTYASAFHDITSGSNACVAGPANCTAIGMSGYAAGPGYDLATGLGSLDYASLLAAWPGGSTVNPALQTTSLLVSGFSESDYLQTIASGQTVTIDLTIASFANSTQGIVTVPSGSLSASLDGVAIAPISITALGTNPFSFIAPADAGSHVLQITYPGDSTHTSASLVYPVLVGTVVAGGNIALTSSNLTLATNASGNIPITVTPSGGYHGRVVWSLTATGGDSGVTACYSISSLHVASSATPPTVQLSLGNGTACSSTAAAAAFRRIPAAPHQAGLVPPGAVSSASRDAHPSRLVGAAASLFLLCLLGKRRRMPFAALLSAFLFLAASSLSGCGGGGGQATPPPPTQPAPSVFQLTLTGTDSVNTAITASTSFTLTIN